MSAIDVRDAKAINEGQLVTFELGSEVFGINIENVKEIVRYPKVTSVPVTADYLSGLANLRGVVFPIIDTRVRLGLGHSMITDNTRVLVIDSDSSLTGLVVDRVRGVESLEDGVISLPPAVLNSDVDARYIKSIVELNKKDIILELDLEVLCEIRVNSSTDKKEPLKAAVEDASEARTIDEKQIVTFTVAGEEYAFPIDVVKEVLRVGEIVQVPKAPSYIVGILSIRDNILPVIDIRKVFELPSLSEELIGFIDNAEAQHRLWADEIRASSGKAVDNVILSDLNHCPLSRWIDSFRTSSENISRLLQNLKSLHTQYHHVMSDVVGKIKKHATSGESDIDMDYILRNFIQLKDVLNTVKEAIKSSIGEDQRILVVEIGRISVGILVDRIQQVLRIQETSIEAPSSILSTEKADMVKGIAKLDNGSRFILLLDEQKILSEDALQDVMDIGDTVGNESRNIETTRAKDIEEIQYVTFNLDKEEFGIEIKEIQEINRLDRITSIPRSPSFIEGVMNLRGNVIPVIDLRKRFKMATTEHNDSTRVIIINIVNELTGLIVDSVSEVIRVSRTDIQPAPDIVKDDVKSEFLKGIGKYNKRMFLILDISRILSKEEQQELKEVSKEGTGSTEEASERVEAMTPDMNRDSQRTMKTKKLKKAE